MRIVFKHSKELVDYLYAVKHMDEIVDSIIVGKADETVWFLEHESLYTAGSSAELDELIDPNEFPVYQSGRGGRHTYHGPGQRVIYLMLDLKKRFAPNKPDLRKYILLLEEVIIQTLNELGVEGERRHDRIGIWVDVDGSEKKIAAIGVRVRKLVAYHGVAINVAPNLSHFDGIIPCGIKDYGVTSLHSLGKSIDMIKFDDIFKDKFNSIFNNINAFNF